MFLIQIVIIYSMIVTGYDTCLPEDAIISVVSKHFSSCGEIVAVLVVAESESESGFVASS